MQISLDATAQGQPRAIVAFAYDTGLMPNLERLVNEGTMGNLAIASMI